HPTYIRIGISNDTYIFRHLHPLLENTVPLILEKVNYEIYLIIKKFSFNPDVGFDRPFPCQIIRTDPCFIDGFYTTKPPNRTEPLISLCQIRETDIVDDPVVSHCTIRSANLKVI